MKPYNSKARIVLDIATRHGVTVATKSKSMATEEIHLNRALGAAGVEPDRIAIDPGIGFGKTVAHNLAQLAIAAVVIRHAGIIVYLPYMLLGSLPTGLLTGAAAAYALRARGAALGKWLSPDIRR